MFGISCKPGCRSSIPGKIDLSRAKSKGGVKIDWTLDEASQHFEELVDRAISVGPQRVIRDHDTLVIEVSVIEREKWHGSRSLKEMILNGPDLSDLDLSRDQSPEREFER